MFSYLLHQKTPLHVAAEGGHIEIVKYLDGKGAAIRGDNNEVRRTRCTTESRLVSFIQV